MLSFDTGRAPTASKGYGMPNCLEYPTLSTWRSAGCPSLQHQNLQIPASNPGNQGLAHFQYVLAACPQRTTIAIEF